MNTGLGTSIAIQMHCQGSLTISVGEKVNLLVDQMEEDDVISSPQSNLTRENAMCLATLLSQSTLSG